MRRKEKEGVMNWINFVDSCAVIIVWMWAGWGMYQDLKDKKGQKRR